MQEQLFPIPQGKLISEKNFQAYCGIDVGEEKEGSAYCCRNCKLKLETIVKKIVEMRELFYKTIKEKVKRLHLPTGESQLAKEVCVNKDSEQSAPVAKRGLGFAASRGENQEHQRRGGESGTQSDNRAKKHQSAGKLNPLHK